MSFASVYRLSLKDVYKFGSQIYSLVYRPPPALLAILVGFIMRAERTNGLLIPSRSAMDRYYNLNVAAPDIEEGPPLCSDGEGLMFRYGREKYTPLARNGRSKEPS